ncbi:MAG TPA: hypothetical protein VFF30_04665 [Nitrososphaerales archaeon]|nr:hypothetical protein [Nitrososphaerales archaeon]
MNTASGFLLFLVAAFALIVALVLTPALRYYTGAFFIFLFMGGLFFAWLNTIRQTNKMKDETGQAQPKTEGKGADEEKNKEQEQKPATVASSSSSSS